MAFAFDLGLERLIDAPAVELSGVSVVEHISQLDRVSAGTVVVLARSVDVSGYRLDAATRTLSERGAAALVLIDPPRPLSPTVYAIAERAGPAVLATAVDVDVGALCMHVTRVIDAGAAQALMDASAFVTALRSSDDRSPERVAELARDMMAADAPAQGAPGVARQLALVTAGEISARWEQEERRRVDAPIRSRGVVLTELLLAAPHRTSLVADRARTLGLPVDGWHTVVRLELEASDEDVVRAALETARAGGGVWHAALLDSAIVLVRMDRAEPGQRRTAGVTETARRVIAGLPPAGEIRCGVGTPHAGLAGLRSSDAEARSALDSGPAGVVNAFDPAGLQRMLVEWYANDAARASVEQLLAPLDALGGRRTVEAVRTLRAYLDHGGSLVAAGRELHLHRNAVAYRIKRIVGTLGVDLDDPDQRLALHLAVRARAV